jgi:hypothetical protein
MWIFAVGLNMFSIYVCTSSLNADVNLSTVVTDRNTFSVAYAFRT